MTSKQFINNNRPQYVRVLMIGPGEGVGGGIFALVETLLPILEKQVALFYLPSVSHRQLKDSGKLSFRNVLIALSQYGRFLAALFRFRPHIIHLHTSQGIAWLKDTFYVIAGKVFHARVILHMHGGNFDKIYEEYPAILQSYTRSILGMADAIISVSTEWKIRLSKIIPVDRITPLKNCIDIQAFQQNSACKTSRRVDILFIGRIGPQKGTYDLIEAIHLLSIKKYDFYVRFVGPEERDGDLKLAHDLLEKYHISQKCELLGNIKREVVSTLFRESDLFVLPSYYEGLPMVIIEAMAAGLPIITTSVGGIPEVVRESYNGFLISPGIIEELTDALEKLVSNKDLRIIMGQRSREIAECEFDVQSYAGKISDLYSSLVNS